MVRVLTVNSVRLSLQKSNPRAILVEADGTVGTPGWKNFDLVPLEDPVSADGILDLEFVGTPPTGIIIQVQRPASADFIITKDVDKIVGVVVHARNGSVTQLLSVPDVELPPPPLPDPFKTFAVGEEGPSSFFTGGITKSFTIAEEGGPFFTQAVGETPPTPLNVELMKPPIADIQFTPERFPGVGPRPGPDPAPDFSQVQNTPFGTR